MYVSFELFSFYSDLFSALCAHFSGLWLQEPEYLAGRQAHIIFKGEKIGTFGIVHPQVHTDYSPYLLDSPFMKFQLVATSLGICT